MNLGDNRWHTKYICDKCGEKIEFKYRKGFSEIHHYYTSKKGQTPYKTFDLCRICEKELREWLNIKLIPTSKRMIDKFPRYEE